MYWNRFDICAAFYLYAVNYHSGQWSKEYAIHGRLAKLGFSPGLSVQNGELEENAQAIYENLIRTGNVREF